MSTRRRFRGGSKAAVLLLALAAALPGAARSPRDEVPAAGDAVPVAIPAIQGRGDASPWRGRRVRVEGIVTQRLARGFALQAVPGDGDPATSDAIVVTGGRGRLPEVGERVQLDATVQEATPGRRGPGAGRRTELRRDAGITVLGRSALPPAVTLGGPLDAQRAEALEAMRVQWVPPFVVADARVAGARGRLLLATGQDRPRAATDRMPPGPAALAQQAADVQRLVVLDVPAAAADADVRAGDRGTAPLTGVLDAAGAEAPHGWRLVADAAPVFARATPRPARPPAVPGGVKVAFANLQNWFTSLRDAGDCAPGGCRGARDMAAWLEQRTRLVAMLTALDADVIGLAEIENDADGGALQALVEALNAASAPGRYAAVPPLPPLRDSADAIRVGLVYQPARVAPRGPARQDADPAHGRPPLAQRFAPRTPAAGAAFSVVVAHLKSRRCDGDAQVDADAADPGDGSGCHDARRTRQAQALAAFARGVAAEGGVLVLGDLNAHARERPLQRLQAAGLGDLLAPRGDPYTYVHEGFAGRLDHALADAAMAARVRGAAVWHVNADEPAPAGRRGRATDASAHRARNGAAAGASDHDPLLVGIGP